MKILDIIKTVHFNLKVFKFSTAIKLPVYIGSRTIIENITKDCIEIPKNVTRAMIRIGSSDGSPGISTKNDKSYIGTDGKSKIIFTGKAIVTKGCTLKAINGGVLTIGNNFYSNSFCKFLCKKSITIGDDNLFGWNCTVNDGDGHTVYEKGTKKITNQNKEVSLGNHVWVGSCAALLKGTEIGSNSIVGYGSCVTRRFNNESCIIAGTPAKIVKENIEWEH